MQTLFAEVPPDVDNSRDNNALHNYIKEFAKSCVRSGDIDNAPINNIHVISHELLWSAMPALYHSFDGFVLSSHGEGWGLPLAEAMTMGLPVIATNWSGPIEYMSPSNSIAIPVHELVNVSGVDFTQQEDISQWAKPDQDALQRAMRQLIHPAARPFLQQIGRQARNDMLTRYNIDRIAVAVMKELYAIKQKMIFSSVKCQIYNGDTMEQLQHNKCCWTANDKNTKLGCYDRIPFDQHGQCQCTSMSHTNIQIMTRKEYALESESGDIARLQECFRVFHNIRSDHHTVTCSLLCDKLAACIAGL